MDRTTRSESEVSSRKTPPSSAPSRIRRNTACTSCRDSKVKCNASSNGSSHTTCSRCMKLGIECIVDKSHKRTTRRSKLEALEKEVLSIKNAVGTHSTPSAQPRPPSNESTSHQGSPEAPEVTLSKLPEKPAFAFHTALRPVVPPAQDSSPSFPPSRTSPSNQSRARAQARALGSKALSGEDIDYYFDVYFEHYHPHLPVVRTRDPDVIYAASPLLFWTIITVACKHYSKDDSLYLFFADNLPGEVWSAMVSPPAELLSTINALLVLVAWPFMTPSISIDPTPRYVSLANYLCLMAGLHTGKARHSEFNTIRFYRPASDEEAIYTWTACCIMSHRVSSCQGLPSQFMFNNSSFRITEGRPITDALGYLGLQHEVQRFSHRVARTMWSILEEQDSVGIPPSVIQGLENEFDGLKRMLLGSETPVDDLDHLAVLSVQAELQSYYLCPPATKDPLLFRQNVSRYYITAKTILDVALRLKDDPGRKLILHAPYTTLRGVTDACCGVFQILMSNHAATENDVSGTMKTIFALLRSCIYQEGDLPSFVSWVGESAWTLRHLMPPLAEPISEAPHRLAASVPFGCVRRWRREIEKLREADRRNKEAAASATQVPEMQHQQQPQQQQQHHAVADQVPIVQYSEHSDPNMIPMGDPLGDIDWSMLMDGIDWAGPGGEDALILGL